MKMSISNHHSKTSRTLQFPWTDHRANRGRIALSRVQAQAASITGSNGVGPSVALRDQGRCMNRQTDNGKSLLLLLHQQPSNSASIARTPAARTFFKSCELSSGCTACLVLKIDPMSHRLWQTHVFSVLRRFTEVKQCRVGKVQ